MTLTRDGGKPICKPMPYDPPKGPASQRHEGPGLGGTNHGKGGTQQGISPNHPNTPHSGPAWKK